MTTRREQRVDLEKRYRSIPGCASQTKDEVAATQFCLTLAECFTPETSDAISFDRPSHQTLRNDQREPRITEGIDDAVKRKALRSQGAARLERCGYGSGAQPPVAPQTGGARQTASRARPFARRARITARPPRVRILTRKPWARLRRRREGWYVRFIGSS